jgi:hypothetical protein
MKKSRSACASEREGESRQWHRSKWKAFLANIVAYLVIGFCIGCASMGGGRSEEDLMAAAVKFNDAVRWQNYKNAAVFLDASHQEAFWKVADRLSDKVRVTEYEIRSVSREEPSSAVLLIKYSYFRLNDPRIKPATLHQKWRYEEKAGMWKVTQPDIEAMLP